MLIKALVVASQILLAHSFYDPSCCGGNDCRPVPCKEIVPRPDGTVEYHGIVYNKSLFKTSPDGACHVCYNENSKSPYCVYFPAGT